MPNDVTASNGPTPPNAAQDTAAAEVIFEIVVTAMWSDGELVTSEVERGRAVATVLAVSPRGGGAFGAIAKGPLRFDTLQFEALDPRTSQLAFAAAHWATSANAEPSKRRAGFLEALRLRLKIQRPQADRLSDLAATASHAHHDPVRSFESLAGRLQATYQPQPAA